MNRVLLGVIVVALFFPFTVVAAGDGEDEDGSRVVEAVDLDTPISEPGILVARVIDDSPARKAGMLRGDIILEVESTGVNTITDLREILSDYEGGDIVDVLISRGGEEQTVLVELETRLYRPAFGIEAAAGTRPFFMFDSDGYGFPMRPDFHDLPFPSNGGRFGFRQFGGRGIPGDLDIPGNIVAAVEADSPADRAGILKGDVIVRVGDVTLDQTTVAGAIANLSPNDTVEIELRRGTDEEELQTVVVTATLGSNDDGGAYLGISYLPLRMMHMGEYMEGMMERMHDHMELTVPQDTDL